MSGTNLKFGIFNVPFHGFENNPISSVESALESSLESSLRCNLNLVERLDRLNYDEIWFDDFQSSDADRSDDREAFISKAIASTQHITIGINMAAPDFSKGSKGARITRDRVAFLLGLNDPGADQQQDIQTMVQELADDAHPKIMIASGLSAARAKIAGSCGLGMLSVDATSAGGFNALASNWEVYERYAKKNSQRIDRSAWSLVGPIHIARTRKQALIDVRERLDQSIKRFQEASTVTLVPPNCDNPAQAMIDSGLAVIGTPRDAINQIKRLQESTGGFGTFLQMAHNWADPDKTQKSYELFAQAVAPKFRTN